MLAVAIMFLENYFPFFCGMFQYPAIPLSIAEFIRLCFNKGAILGADL